MALWLACVAVNLFKAVHIDDTAHLAIARHILRDPLHPMQAEVFWGLRPEPAHALNQPHLFFYLLAGLLAVSNSSAVAHLAVSSFAGLALWATHRLTWRASGRLEDGVFAAAALGLGPALAPSQNLMTDVPLLGLWSAALWSMSRPPTDRPAARVAAIGTLIGLACLVKYTSLVLLPLFAWWLFTQHREALWALAIPVAALAAWSAFNVWDYGGVHLLGRRISVSEDAPGLGATMGLVVGRAALWVVTLGALCPFTLAFIPRAAARFGRARLVAVALIGLPALTAGGQIVAAVGPEVLRGETWIHSGLRGLFFLNGLLALALAGAVLRRHADSPLARLLGLYVLGAALFIVVLSPFVAVRHVLLVLPALLALLSMDAEAPGPAPRAAALALTLVIGLGVGIADWRIADAYRRLPDELSLSTDRGERVYFVGHWGFQHYAERAGWRPYVPGETELAPGDTVVRPRMVDQPPLAEEDLARLRPVREVTLEASALDLFRTVTPRLGYYSVWHGLPWTLTLEPLEVVEILEVVEAPAA